MRDRDVVVRDLIKAHLTKNWEWAALLSQEKKQIDNKRAACCPVCGVRIKRQSNACSMHCNRPNAHNSRRLRAEMQFARNSIKFRPEPKSIPSWVSGKLSRSRGLFNLLWMHEHGLLKPI